MTMFWRRSHTFLPLELNGCEIIYQDCQDTQHTTWWWILFWILFWICRQLSSGQPTTGEGIKLSRSDFLKPKFGLLLPCSVAFQTSTRVGSIFSLQIRFLRIDSVATMGHASGIACRSKGTAIAMHDRPNPNEILAFWLERSRLQWRPRILWQRLGANAESPWTGDLGLDAMVLGWWWALVLRGFRCVLIGVRWLQWICRSGSRFASR